jgi:MFS family permease
MVIVNTVVLVRGELGRGDTAVAAALGVFGGGSMLAALLLPRLLGRVPDRPVMLAGAGAMTFALAGLAVAAVPGLSWPALLVGWFVIGVGYSAVLTPSGRLLRRSSHPEDRPSLFAAQFALSHTCWLLTYPLSGWLVTAFGAATTLSVLAFVSAVGLILAVRLWPFGDPRVLAHRHDDLPLDHPHLRGSRDHTHDYVIDAHHPRWVRQT